MGRRASDLLGEGLEAEGVRWVFGIPGEETLDLSESLDRSGIRFVPVRHEQGGALIADVIGRLTGRAPRVPGAIMLVPVAPPSSCRSWLIAPWFTTRSTTLVA